jgi:hypothetical protein
MIRLVGKSTGFSDGLPDDVTSRRVFPNLEDGVRSLVALKKIKSKHYFFSIFYN